jgi:hypothetical protein
LFTFIIYKIQLVSSVLQFVIEGEYDGYTLLDIDHQYLHFPTDIIVEMDGYKFLDTMK